jgi:hypothetical protein
MFLLFVDSAVDDVKSHFSTNDDKFPVLTSRSYIRMLFAKR